MPPTWSYPPKDATAMEGEAIALDCLANGYPLPVPVWSKASPSPPSAAKAVQNFRPIGQVLPKQSYR